MIPRHNNRARAEIHQERLLLACMGLLLVPLGARLRVTLAGIDPACALRRLLLFPEWRFGLEIIHDVFAGGKCGAAMSGRDRDQHYLLQRQHGADPVNHQRLDNIPARTSMRDDLRQCFFGHTGIVLQGHGSDAGALVHVAHGTDETDDRANLGMIEAQRGNLATEIEVGSLNADGHGAQKRN